MAKIKGVQGSWTVTADGFSHPIPIFDLENVQSWGGLGEVTELNWRGYSETQSKQSHQFGDNPKSYFGALEEAKHVALVFDRKQNQARVYAGVFRVSDFRRPDRKGRGSSIVFRSMAARAV
jgi:hypothetical protein